MEIPGYSTLTAKEKELLHALLEYEGLRVDAKAMRDGDAKALGINWCKIMCAVKFAAQVVACGGNVACIVQATSAAIACNAACK